MDGRDHQHLRGRIIGRIGIGLDQVQQLGHSLPDAPGIVLEVVLHIVGAQHQDDQIQRVVAGKAHRQTGAAIAAQIDGVFKHSGAATAALLNDPVRRAKGQLQPPGPAHVIRVASAVQGKAEGVAIAIAQDIFHTHSLPFHCLHSVLRLFWGRQAGLAVQPLLCRCRKPETTKEPLRMILLYSAPPGNTTVFSKLFPAYKMDGCFCSGSRPQ